ncbi:MULTISPECIES: IclR family transcriptional regulator [Desulfosporosinus]|uniref:IclR family transcriptional regulator n=1 Tax=Desulfosporosinus nitroreducens TaxID=2018668 RepID=A0ABT8QKP4_9FIRM|nr:MULTISPECIES: IclR family transcriptional regulator [Desulfosporosinus]MCO1600374.1 IclR family transcriptional regulator [Desulfosporosinus nitroreducens]MCO5386749.1 IclR family transcriptional regulator [Desulfosporosinus sp.]MDA8222822.1 IclR family transcriptional regulator [Desulfitobacterium hafniense]MDO0821462.1 IclR family transcriptional regulator [Desulfosporosinus nitroreducens]
MRLKEKTHRKFVEFFEKISTMYQGKDFELAYSDIQRETGAASVTLKRAIQALAEDGVIEVQPGRNSRYARFKYLLAAQDIDENSTDALSSDSQGSENLDKEETPHSGRVFESMTEDVGELLQLVDHLKRRVRNQEMAIALLQDRLAEIEDKIRKR